MHMKRPIGTLGMVGLISIAALSGCGTGTEQAEAQQTTAAVTAVAPALPADTGHAERAAALERLKGLPTPGPAVRATPAQVKAIEAAIAAQVANPQQLKD